MGFLRRPQNLKKIIVVLLKRASCSVRATAYLSKSWRRFKKTNVAKSYYTNFNSNICNRVNQKWSENSGEIRKKNLGGKKWQFSDFWAEKKSSSWRKKLTSQTELKILQLSSDSSLLTSLFCKGYKNQTFFHKAKSNYKLIQSVTKMRAFFDTNLI